MPAYDCGHDDSVPLRVAGIPTKVGIQVGIFQRYAGRNPGKVGNRKTWMPVFTGMTD